MYQKILAFFLVAAPLAAATTPNNYANQQQPTLNVVESEQVKAWYDQNKPIVVVDARSKELFTGTTLPNAKWVPFNATDAEIQAALPSKSAIVVTYCCGETCPASSRLAQRLQNMGYKTVYHYEDGLRDWMKKGYPLDNR